MDDALPSICNSLGSQFWLAEKEILGSMYSFLEDNYIICR